MMYKYQAEVLKEPEGIISLTIDAEDMWEAGVNMVGLLDEKGIDLDTSILSLNIIKLQDDQETPSF